MANNDKVVVYYVDRDDYSFENIIVEYKTQNELDVDYKTVVFVCDRYRNEVIDGVGFYTTGRPSNASFKRIVDEAVQNLYNKTQFKNFKTRKSLFDDILGLTWNMPISQAITHLNNYGLSGWHPVNDNMIACISPIYWDNFLYDAVTLQFFVTNNQEKILSSIKFVKFFDNQSNKAKEFRDKVYRSLARKFGEGKIASGIDVNGFKNYQVFDILNQEIATGKKIAIGRIIVEIQKYNNTYSVQVTYSSMEEACREILESNK